MDASFAAVLGGIPPEKQKEIFTQPQAWAETFLISPVTNLLFAANFVQRQILNSTHRFNVLRVHRRAGKSFSMTVLALFYALMFPSVQILVIGPAGSHVNEIFTTIRDFLRVNPLWSQFIIQNKSSLPQRITFKNGSRISGFTTAARSKGKGTGIRGQGADILLIDEAAFLAEGDWEAINAIMLGDSHRRWPPRVFVASTPAHTRGVYHSLCQDLEKKFYPDGSIFWNEVQCGIETNPDKSEKDVAEARAMASSQLEYTREWLAQFPDLGEGVFPKRMVDRALRPINYTEELAAAVLQSTGVERVPSRTIGVDWDKYNADGRGSNIVVLESLAEGKSRLIYREEIPQSEFTLTNAVRRVVELNDLFQPEWIYVDRGFGDMQVEELQKHGERFPLSGLTKKVVGIQFAQNVEQALPGGGIEKIRFKQRMVQLLRSWFERDTIELSDTDNVLVKELMEYHITHQTETNLKFSSENDHAIAAFGLAAMAMFQKVKDPYSPRAATRSYHVKAPESIAVANLTASLPVPDGRTGRWSEGMHDPFAPPASMRRGKLGTGPPVGRGSF